MTREELLNIMSFDNLILLRETLLSKSDAVKQQDYLLSAKLREKEKEIIASYTDIVYCLDGCLPYHMVNYMKEEVESEIKNRREDKINKIIE